MNASEMFEGPNSSLRKTFDGATSNIHQEASKEWKETEDDELTPFERELAQAILGALEYRGFYDCGKYLDASLIEGIRPLLTSQAIQIREEECNEYNRIIEERDQAIRERVEGMRKKYDMKSKLTQSYIRVEGYNQCLDDILALLTDDKV